MKANPSLTLHFTKKGQDKENASFHGDKKWNDFRIIPKVINKTMCFLSSFLPPPTWLAVPLAARNCRVRDLSCSRQ